VEAFASVPVMFVNSLCLLHLVVQGFNEVFFSVKVLFIALQVLLEFTALAIPVVLCLLRVTADQAFYVFGRHLAVQLLVQHIVRGAQASLGVLANHP
jgi:hypothetical protein